MDVSKFRAHLGEPVEFKIGMDTFKFKPLSVTDLPEFLTILAKLSKAPEPNEAFSLLDKEDIDIVIRLIRKMIINSYPEIEKELGEANLDNFIGSNFFALLTALFESNSLGASKIEKPPILDKISKNLPNQDAKTIKR